MDFGSPNRPRAPLHVMGMALALALAAFAGGALGLVWHWLAGEDTPEDQIEAISAEPDEDEAAEDEEEDEAERRPPPAPPRPSPNVR